MKKEIIFTLPAEALEGATEVVILGDFNNWSPADEYKLERQQDGTFKTIVFLEEGKSYQYRFLLNDGRWVNDYHAQNYLPVYDLYIENSVITVPATSAESEDKKVKEAPAKKEAVAVKKDKAPKETEVAKPEVLEAKKPEVLEAKSKKPAAPKSAKAKAETEKVKAKKADKPEKATKTVKTAKKEAPKKQDSKAYSKRLMNGSGFLLINGNRFKVRLLQPRLQ